MSKYFDGKDPTFMAPEVKENGRHMVMTNVQPDIKTKYVNIDTRFQSDYNMQYFADVTFKLPQQISNVKSIKVTNIEIPASFYPFSLRRRNTFFTITDNTSSSSPPKLISIDDRFYTKATITSAISSQLAPLDISFGFHNATDTDETYKLVFHNHSSTKNYTIQFNVDEKGNADKNNLKSKLGWCLGFREQMYVLKSQKEIVSEAILNLNPFCYLYISVDDFHSHNPNSFIAPSIHSYMNPNILGRVSLEPWSYTFGGLIVANYKCGSLLTDTRTYEGKSDIQKLRIQILDEFGVVVDLNQMDFAFALEIIYT
jgi:hypothetical protein